MKIVFVHTGMESLGIGYLSSVLKRKGHRVELVYAPSLFRSFRFDLPFLHVDNAERAAQAALRREPDVVCFSVESDHFSWACRVASRLKDKRADLPIVFGGIHPTCAPEAALAAAVDYVCVGEGEQALPELVERIAAGRTPEDVDNIVYRRDGRIVRNPLRPLIADLDGVPFPDKSLFFDAFPGFVKGAYSIVTGRGCPHNCAYCHNNALRRIFQGRGRYFRRRSVANVIAELKSAKARYAFERVSFCDDTFTSDPAWLREFAPAYRQEIALPFYCAVHPSCIDQERVRLLEEAGCGAANLGIQTLNETLRRDGLSRTGSNQEIIDALRAFRGSRIFVFTNFIFGLPGQDLRELEAIVEFCALHGADFHDVNWLRYYPGTAIVELARQDGLLSEDMIRRINGGNEFKPYAHGGHSFSSQRAQLRNLLFLSHFMPGWLVRLFLRSRLYRLLPGLSLRSPAVVLRLLVKKHAAGKRHPYPNFSISDTFHYYLHFLGKASA
ncbi:MAG TPA: hypothetical protein DEB40_14475 [Elusimicrobia bacterium]|nr:hypothetical protein [Elusimicrobiota bacterium]HBT62939.1 hypothetical protein [Elusimicrobiota bacterium]